MLSSEPGHTKTGRWELGGVEAGCEREETERGSKSAGREVRKRVKRKKVEAGVGRKWINA